MVAFQIPSAVRTTAELRSVARRLGLVPYLSRVRSLLHRVTGAGSYEAHFERALMASIRTDDVVWDVGANVGLYTSRFSERVGPGGRVIAFEPFPSCYSELQRRTASLANVTAHRTALGATSGSAPMSVDGDPLSCTNSLAAQPTPGATTIDVPVSTGQDLVAAAHVPSPNVLKIDVEGFEEEVFEGLGTVLTSPSCRAIFCEVHFAILDQRGRRQAPARIESLLRRSGFTVRWVDASHLEARRSA